MAVRVPLEEPEVEAPAYLPLGVHLAGSIPLASAEEVFRTVSDALGERLRRLPDGETGARADWIVWQYAVLSARPEFEIAPPTADFYRALPRLRLRDEAAASSLRLGSLGYADAAEASYRTFRQLKREGVVPSACRFQVCLPTPLAPMSAFVAPESQAAVEEVYEAAMLHELEQLLEAVPHDQLALQWDTNFEFGMLEGDLAAWFADVRGGVLDRLIRLARAVPAEVELGFHLCYGDGKDERRRPQSDLRLVVDIANALTAGAGRTLDWVHMPASGDPADAAFFAPLRDLRLRPETELHLGLLLPGEAPEATLARVAVAHELAGELGLATPCGWGRLAPGRVPELLAAHVRCSRPITTRTAQRRPFAWPPGFARIPAQEWVARPVDSFGLAYDTVENHGWYRNLDPTVEQLARALRDGDILIDYSGGTGILLDRLLLRIFDRQVGLLIADSSPKFLRVAVERFRDEERVAFRRLHYLKEERRLELLEEVVDGIEADAIVTTNAIHLYYDLEDTLASWAKVLKPGGRVFVNSGNVRSPAVAPNEWIIDETVGVIHEVATGIVRADERWAAHRAALEDEEALARHLEYRDRVFLAPRPLDYYLGALEGAGFAIDSVSSKTIEADVSEWFEFLSAYGDAVLGWVEDAEDRLELMRRALDVIFGGRSTFLACWTYVEARRR